jgi:hypothetical protein
MILTSDISVYFDSLVARVSTATVVPLLEKEYTESDFNTCHDNAARWVAEHPEYEVVQGWLLWPHGGPPYMLHAHSVVSGPTGLLDATPLRASDLHFLTHEGTDQDFQFLAKNFAQYTHGLDYSQMFPPSEMR